MFSQEAVDNMREASLQMGFKAGVTAEQERIIKLLREKAIDLKRIFESIDEDECMNAGDGDAPYWGSFALDDFADALIKGENNE